MFDQDIKLTEEEKIRRISLIVFAIFKKGIIEATRDYYQTLSATSKTPMGLMQKLILEQTNKQLDKIIKEEKESVDFVIGMAKKLQEMNDLPYIDIDKVVCDLQNSITEKTHADITKLKAIFRYVEKS